ncbi:hypothetical protein [Streptomyces sp. CRB46]|uniref:hypothetical protein n=1 Tax=Streptomyces sp. CRB46 TaxID=2682613 RepID=UPI0018F2D4E5|nr:hypothetical protein [Streptomyces sp. CRB46]
MPRRRTPLNPEDGPKARFAIALRRLEDEAGFDAKTIAAIAAENHIPESTLHAAMRGLRIPTVPVLAALVRAWGGDEKEWRRRRTEVEDELERTRLRRQSETPGDPDEYSNDQLVAMLMAMGERDGQRSETRPGDPAPLDADDVIAALETEEQRLLFLQEHHNVPTVVRFWRQLLYRAGQPSQRKVAFESGLPQRTVGQVLRGRQRDPRFVNRVYGVLTRMEERVARHAAWDAT